MFGRRWLKCGVAQKCGREFKNQNQSHYCGKAPMTIDQYIDAQSEESQPYLLEVRKSDT